MLLGIFEGVNTEQSKTQILATLLLSVSSKAIVSRWPLHTRV